MSRVRLIAGEARGLHSASEMAALPCPVVDLVGYTLLPLRKALWQRLRVKEGQQERATGDARRGVARPGPGGAEQRSTSWSRAARRELVQRRGAWREPAGWSRGRANSMLSRIHSTRRHRKKNIALAHQAGKTTKHGIIKYNCHVLSGRDRTS